MTTTIPDDRPCGEEDSEFVYDDDNDEELSELHESKGLGEMKTV